MDKVKLYACMLLYVATAMWSGLYAHNDYKTDLLNEISVCMKLHDTISNMPNGEYYGKLKYGNKPLTVIIDNGVVEHIGYMIFTKCQRDGLRSPVCNFVERYLLESSLPLKRDKNIDTRMHEDDVHFNSGKITDLYRLMQDTSNTISVKLLDGRRYELRWYNLTGDVCSLDFPVDYGLLNGSEMLENERRLEKFLLHPVNIVGKKDSMEIKRDYLLATWQSNYFILPGKSYYTDALTSNRYYEKDDLSGSYRLVYNTKYPQESIANLLTTAEIENEFLLDVKFVKYGGANSRIAVPLNSWVQYCIKSGCEPFFGIISYDGNIAECEVIMRNEAMGYNHIMKVTFDVSLLEAREGSIKTRLNSYVPFGNIKFLFEELNK